MDVRAMRPDERARVEVLLAGAFQREPFSQWAFPDEDERRRGLAGLAVAAGPLTVRWMWRPAA